MVAFAYINCLGECQYRTFGSAQPRRFAHITAIVILIAYVSTSAASEVSTELLGSILETSGRNNARDGITGALLVSGDRFFQVLEGRAWVVERTFDRICEDPRRTEVTLVWEGEASGRMFDGFTMVAVTVDPADRINVRKVVDEASTKPTAAISTLWKLVKKQRRSH